MVYMYTWALTHVCVCWSPRVHARVKYQSTICVYFRVSGMRFYVCNSVLSNGLGHNHYPALITRVQNPSNYCSFSVHCTRNLSSLLFRGKAASSPFTLLFYSVSFAVTMTASESKQKYRSLFLLKEFFFIAPS